MTAVNPVRNNMQAEECAPQGAVSESVMVRMAQSVMFANLRHVYQHDFNMNGSYNGFVTPVFLGDGFMTYPFPFEILDVMIMTGDANGSGGTTEFDVKWRPETGGTFVSIFSTTPKFTNAAPTLRTGRVGGSAVTGITNPVLDKTTFDAYDVLIVQALQACTGTVNGAFLKVFIRPISDPEV